MRSRLTFAAVGLAASFQLSALLPSNSNAQSLCLRMIKDSGVAQSVAVSPGTIMRVGFRHSIYGSQVEERFALRNDGFYLTQLRYGEARLVDFYGHEDALYDDGAWIVSPAPTRILSLDLKTSTAGAIMVQFDFPTASKPLIVHPKSALRLTLASCTSSAHG